MPPITLNVSPARRAVLGFGIGLLLPSLARGDALTDGRFYQEVAAILRATRPAATIIPDSNPQQIRVDQFTFFLGNLYTRVEGLDPTARRKTIESYLARALVDPQGEPDRGSPGFADAKPRLRIQLAPKPAVAHAGTLAQRPFSDLLAVTYVLDEAERYQYVTLAMLDSWKTDAASIERQAIANLEAASKETAISLVVADGTPVLAMVMTGDGYDAARLLLPGFLAEIRHALKAEALTVAAPTRDLLMAWPPDSRARVTLAADVRKQMKQGPYSRSDELFHVDQAGLRPLTIRERADHDR
ncbi:hypothetical protein AEGHOMDF_3858 [Methylobacterium soli]|nr:hypothetical protein AEGHOMDF_3858 [Methylobacterium soli]